MLRSLQATHGAASLSFPTSARKAATKVEREPPTHQLLTYQELRFCLRVTLKVQSGLEGLGY